MYLCFGVVFGVLAHAFNVGILMLGGRLAATLSRLLLLGWFRNRRGTSAGPGWAAERASFLLSFAPEGHKSALPRPQKETGKVRDRGPYL